MKWILDLLKGCKDRTELLSFPLMLTSYIIMAQLSKLRNYHCYHIINWTATLFRFHPFSMDVLFLFQCQIQDLTLHLVFLSCPCQFLSPLHSFMTLIIFLKDLFISKRESTWVQAPVCVRGWGVQRKRGSQLLSEHGAAGGAWSLNLEITTWAKTKVSHPTDWAPQGPIMTLILLKSTDQVFFRTVLNLCLSDTFSWSDRGHSWARIQQRLCFLLSAWHKRVRDVNKSYLGWR